PRVASRLHKRGGPGKPAHPAGTFGALKCGDAASRCRLPESSEPEHMKKLIAALVLATSFAALADDAAKPADTTKSSKKSKKAKKSTKADAPADAAAPAK